MNNSGRKVALSGLLICSFSSLAGTMGSIEPPPMYRPVLSLLGGYAAIAGFKDETFVGTDDELFIYEPSHASKGTGFIGGFAGIERGLPWANLSFQAGIEYDYFWSVRIRGESTAGIQPDTETLYSYQYQIQTQQVLAAFKLLGTMRQIIHPYFSFGLGVAYNKANDFSTSTLETGSINLTPLYSSNTSSPFSYNLGVGVDVNVTEQLRFGLGYRYSNFGRISLGDGVIVLNDFQFPVDFGPGHASLYANQFLAQTTYLF